MRFLMSIDLKNRAQIEKSYELGIEKMNKKTVGKG